MFVICVKAIIYLLLYNIHTVHFISHTAQLPFIRKFYCFRLGPHIRVKNAPNIHLRCPVMREVFLEA